jgi:hypothetical protein
VINSEGVGFYFLRRGGKIERKELSPLSATQSSRRKAGAVSIF